MTKRDYIVIARAISECKQDENLPLIAQEVMRIRLIDSIAAALIADNPRFDMVRFLKACQS